MRALVFGGPRQRSWTEVPDPRIIDPGDAIIRVDTVTICGTDLHILDARHPWAATTRVNRSVTATWAEAVAGDPARNLPVVET